MHHSVGIILFVFIFILGFFGSAFPDSPSRRMPPRKKFARVQPAVHLSVGIIVFVTISFRRASKDLRNSRNLKRGFEYRLVVVFLRGGVYSILVEGQKSSLVPRL